MICKLHFNFYFLIGWESRRNVLCNSITYYKDYRIYNVPRFAVMIISHIALKYICVTNKVHSLCLRMHFYHIKLCIHEDCPP